MTELDSPLPPRRSFLQRLTAAALVLATGGTVTHAAPRRPTGLPALGSDDAWLDRIRGEHRQVFDAVEPNNGFGAAYALNYLDSYKETHPNEEVTAVVVFRHFAMPLVLNDAVWAKYKIGEFLNVTDPESQAPAARNVFHNNIILRPGLTYERMMAEHGVIMTACNLALTVLSGLTAEKAGLPKETAAEEWRAGLLPGVVLVPSGVYAVDRAQEKGCSYCYGG